MWYIHTTDLFIHNKESGADTCYSIEESSNIMLSGKSHSQKKKKNPHILYGPIYIKCPNEANPERQRIDQ